MMRFPIVIILFINISCASTKTSKSILPKERNGIYSFKIHDQVLEIDPAIGGRIISLQLGGKNFLTGKEINADNWGSTFWPSPQKSWARFSLAELDNKPYTVSITGNGVKMVSQQAPEFGYVFTKEFSANGKINSFNIKYTITNRSGIIKSVAPWEITRVRPGGVAFYPHGTGERSGNIANLAQDKNGITWFVYQKDSILAQHNKFFADGSEGWIAQVNEDIIFVKKFTDMPPEKAAPSEAEIEIYTDENKSYVEVELQGAYQQLQTADSLIWEVTWFIRKLPATIKAEPGNAALVTYVRNLIN